MKSVFLQSKEAEFYYYEMTVQRTPQYHHGEDENFDVATHPKNQRFG
ncbi:MAG: hypothetical protein ACN4GF_03540 [Lentimonas sp.]